MSSDIETMKYLQFISILIVMLIFDSYSAKDYYFPVEELTESKIYVYTCKANSLDTEYWKLTYHPKDNTFTTEAFRSNFEQYEFFEEKLTNTGFQLERFVTHIARDRMGRPAKIVRKPIEKDVYLWETEKSYTYSASFIDENYGEVLFEKKRTFDAKEKLIINSKVYDVLKFTADCKTELVSKKEKFTYKQITHYAKNIGMVRSEKQLDDGRNIVLELSDILSLEEWNKLKK